jgi:hypothetical protein
MPEVKKKIPLFGKEMEVADVPIKKSLEPWSEYELEDGSVIKYKSAVSSVLRMEGQNNPGDGNPIYLVLGQPVVVVVSAPPDLIKKG